MKRVLLTGASGLIGRNALPALVEHGVEVHAVSRCPQPHKADGVSWHTVDLFDQSEAEALMNAVKPDSLLHLAWYAEHGLFWSSPENIRWVQASLHLLSAFHQNGGKRAVLAGTCAEYDWNHGFLSEASTPCSPGTLYGSAKDGLRRVAEAFAREVNLSLAWGRIFFVYGPGENPGRLVPAIIGSLLQGQEAKTTDGSQVRDFMHVADVGAAFTSLLESDDVEGPVNIASGAPVRVKEVVETIGRKIGRPELIRYGALPQRPGEPPELVADVSRLRDEVGFVPSYGLEEGIEQTVAWWQAQQRQMATATIA